MRAVKQTLFLAIFMVFLYVFAHAQTGINDVHVTSRNQSIQLDASPALARGTAGIIRKSVELVLVPVTVMDDAHRIISGLRQENFQLYENKRPQSIKNFWKEDEPVSVGIILDVSGSMKDKIDRAREAVMALLNASNTQDEFFLVTFADQPRMLHDFTQAADEIKSELVFATPNGRTSLLDAIVLSVNNMKKARYRRKALVIISDGGDNRSRYTEKDVKSMIKEADVMVYSIGVFDALPTTVEERLGPELLANISGVTGASAYVLDNLALLPRIAEHVALELRNQYILGYSPEEVQHDGKWRKIKVSLALPRGLPSLHVQARTGYYGPTQ